MRRDVYKAIADPTRRQILGLLAGNPLNLNAVAERFAVSRPAISKHIRILSECGLVIIKQTGRERFCYADLKQLKDVSEWTEKYRSFWTRKLDALGQLLEQDKKKTAKNIHQKSSK